jgi:hypothetical protein
VDLDGDGRVDILSGSYSRSGGDMAGLFQVLWGGGRGSFRAPSALDGSDGEPLIIAASKDEVTDKICTRPTAVDLDGDGKLDIVSGNFTGTFALFRGEGKGRFDPKHTWLMAEGERLRVDAHSDPFFVDWDGDGDLDLISGSAQGGVFLFSNQGTRKRPEFGKRIELVPAAGYGDGSVRMGDDWVQGPQTATRVWVDDIDGDGRLDLLIGDTVTICHPAKGLDEATARKKLDEWTTQMQAMMKELQEQGAEASEASQQRIQDAYDKAWKEREKIVREDRTGFVWVMYQK